VGGIQYCYCRKCKKETAHEVYISKGGYLHSLCTMCGKDVGSSAEVKDICGVMAIECSSERVSRVHVKYLSKGNYIHWFCCSCGKDVSSTAQVRSC